ncbi:hypothetical protein ACGFIY_21095 [Micromonospora chersina]|uniref:hypothetical protein n=1 Tax=Micromonospora chersina TaxID=47854 RepID=UPI003719CA60
MTDERDPKVEALAELRQAADEFTAGRDEQERRRERLAAAIVKALQVDIGPSAIEREVPYDRQHIDRIRKAAGIPPKRRATVQRIPTDQGD